MKQGGTFVMVPPPNPYRCPPGPYERVSMIAHIFKQNNPTAKIIILDPKGEILKTGIVYGWLGKTLSGMIEWIDPDTHGGSKSINAEKMEFKTDLDTFKADAAVVWFLASVLERLLRQPALTMVTGPDNSSHYGIKSRSEHLCLGDASVASSMPKSGFSANSQAKVAANAIRGELTGSRVLNHDLPIPAGH